MQAKTINPPVPPTMAAGVRLTLFFIAIAGGSIVLLLAYLFAMDTIIGSDIKGTYSQIIGQNKVGSEANLMFALANLGNDAMKLRDNPGYVLDPNRETSDVNTLELLLKLPGLTSDQKTPLSDCAIRSGTPSNDRVQKLQHCLDVIGDIRNDAIQSAGSVTEIQAASDAVAKLIDGRQSLHSFWLQAAQLILLNLLLPLLTALLGYIFGTQHLATQNANAAQSERGRGEN